MRSIFGWDLPPGVSMRDIDPPEMPCAVCGNDCGSCICPECPVCGSNGDPDCYVDREMLLPPHSTFREHHHGMTRTPEQVECLRVHEAAWAEQARQDAEAEAAYAEEVRQGKYEW